MNARKHIIISLLLTMLVAACSSAQPRTVEVIKTVEMQKVITQVVEAETAPSKPFATAMPPQGVPPIGAKPTPVDNYFKGYGYNPFVDASEDHLSTFALDVDTASYTVARRYIMDGSLPPAESVRVEEFINYFDPGYPSPPDLAFGIYADGAPSPWQNDGTILMRIGIQGRSVSESERKPANLTFVIDVSGSMEREDRLGLVKQSLQKLVDRLRPSDNVAIVVYGTDARVVLNPTSGADRRAILNAIYSLSPEGATNAEAGLNLGYRLAWQTYQQEKINRIILCSDGVANVGNTGPEAILRTIGEYSNQGITLTTIGFGMGNFNDVLMEQLSDKGDGMYAYVDNLNEAERLFVDELTSTLQVVAFDAKVQVDFNNEVVERYRLVGYENRSVADQDFRNDAVDAGEIGAGHSATAIYALLLKPGSQGRLATVQLRWQDPDSHLVREINGNVNTWDIAPEFYATDAHYQLAVVVSQYAELLRASPWSYNTRINDILMHAVRLAGVMPEDEDVVDLAALISRASQIKALVER